MPINIICNNVPRHIVYGYEMEAKDLANFDYLNADELETRQFVKYRGEWYDLNDVQLAPSDIAALGFDGFNADSLWSGIAFRYFDRDGYPIDNGDSVIVGRVFASDE